MKLFCKLNIAKGWFMPFVWEDGPRAGVGWWGEYNYEYSDYSESDIALYAGGDINGKVVININNGSIEDVSIWDVGQFAGGFRLISSRLRDFLINLVGDRVGFFPALCRCRDGVLIGYSLLAPARTISCVDLSRTEVTDWIVPDELVLRYRSIALKEDCLAPMDICRDEHVRHFTIVGDRLAEQLMEAGFTGLRFVRVEEAS